MDIGRLSTELSSERIRDQVGVAVMGKALDTASDQAAAIIKMLESSSPVAQVTDPAIGRNVDLLA